MQKQFPSSVPQPGQSYPDDRHTPVVLMPRKPSGIVCSGNACGVIDTIFKAIAMSHVVGDDRTRYMVICDGQGISGSGLTYCPGPQAISTKIGSNPEDIPPQTGAFAPEVSNAEFNRLLETVNRGDAVVVPVGRFMANYLLSQEVESAPVPKS